MKTTFLELCEDRRIHFTTKGNELLFDNHRDMLKALQLLFDMGIHYSQKKNSIEIDQKYLK